MPGRWACGCTAGSRIQQKSPLPPGGGEGGGSGGQGGEVERDRGAGNEAGTERTSTNGTGTNGAGTNGTDTEIRPVSAGLVVVRRAKKEPGQKSREGGYHCSGEQGAAASFRLQRLCRADLHVAESKKPREPAGLCVGTDPGNCVAVQADVHRDAGDTEGFVDAPKASFPVARGERSVREQPATGAQSGQVDDDAVAVAADLDVLPVNGEVQVGENFER